MYLIDTDIAVHLRDGTPEIVRRWATMADRVAISMMTLVELEGGVAAILDLADRRRAALSVLLDRIDLLACDRDVVAAYGSILSSTGYSRRKVIDRLIAATAIANDLTLATINGDDFRDIPDLRLDVWPSLAQ